MKKVLSVTLAVVLFTSTALPVLAQDNSEPETPQMTTQVAPAIGNPPPRPNGQGEFEGRPASGSARPRPIQTLIKNEKERFASREAALKQKLAQFKNKVKAEKTQIVSDTLNQINQNRTTQMTNNLNRMMTILTNLQTKITPGNAPVDSAITTAKDDITAAQTAVQSQSQKDYTLTVTSERKVASEAATQRQTLFNDLQTSHNLVVKAQQSLVNAIQTAIQSLGGKSDAN